MRKLFLVLFVFGIVTMIFAHGSGRGGGRAWQNCPHCTNAKRYSNNRPPNARGLNALRPAMEAAKPVTVSGNVIIANGMPAVKSGDVTYFLGRSVRLFAVIDGLKEGVQVTIEGRAVENPQDKSVAFLSPSKLTVGGKTYENLDRPFSGNRR